MCRCLPVALIAVLLAYPAFAYHGAHEGGAATGGGSFRSRSGWLTARVTPSLAGDALMSAFG